MKVLHIGSPGRTPDSWLKDGETYTVLAIHSNKQGIEYRIMAGDPPIPALHSARLFKVVSNHLPSSWVVNIDDDERFMEIAPEPWIASGFWEKFFDNDSDAINAFERESYKITAEEN
jgi:hypothetical protein